MVSTPLSTSQTHPKSKITNGISDNQAEVRKNIWILAIVCLLVTALFAFREFEETDGRPGFTQDSSWVDLVLASNLASGKPLVFNPGSPQGPYTSSPLWVLMQTIASVPAGDTVYTAKVLGLVASVGICLATYLLGLSLGLSVKASFTAALFVGLSSRLTSTAGTEFGMILFGLLSLLGLWRYWKDVLSGHYTLTPWLFFGLASMARPEGHILFFLVLIDATLGSGKRMLLRSRNYITLSEASLLYLVLVSPYLIFTFRHTGHLLPAAFQLPGPMLDSADGAGLTGYAAMLLADNPLLFPFVLLGAWLFLRSLWSGYGNGTQSAPRFPALIPAWCVAHPIVSTLWGATPVDLKHLTAPMIPLHMIMALAALAWLDQRLRIIYAKRPYWLPVSIGVGLRGLIYAAIVFSVMVVPSHSRNFGREVNSINNTLVEAGLWLASNTPADAMVAAHLSGAIRFHSQRTVLDMSGLTQPDLMLLLRGVKPGSEKHRTILTEYLHGARPDYMVTPHGFSPFSRASEGFADAIHRIDPAPGESGGSLEILALNWGRYSRAESSDRPR